MTASHEPSPASTAPGRRSGGSPAAAPATPAPGCATCCSASGSPRAAARGLDPYRAHRGRRRPRRGAAAARRRRAGDDWTPRDQRRVARDDTSRRATRRSRAPDTFLLADTTTDLPRPGHPRSSCCTPEGPARRAAAGRRGDARRRARWSSRPRCRSCSASATALLRERLPYRDHRHHRRGRADRARRARLLRGQRPASSPRRCPGAATRTASRTSAPTANPEVRGGRCFDLLLVIILVVLLLPVAVFIATAVRFGGERRDRRLAALRLVGADIRHDPADRGRRGALRRAARAAARRGLLPDRPAVRVPHHLEGRSPPSPPTSTPSAALAVLIVVAVPVAAVAVTLLALRRRSSSRSAWSATAGAARGGCGGGCWSRSSDSPCSSRCSAASRGDARPTRTRSRPARSCC